MGFINAVSELGRLESEKVKARGAVSDPIDDYLQLPMSLADDERRSGKVIRVWLTVEVAEEIKAPDTKELNILGISRIDLVDYMAGSGDINKKKRYYLYRDPVGSNTNWGFSPIYKLGRPKVDVRKEMLGEKGQWPSDEKSRFYKLERRVLSDYEKAGCFSEGSVERIMNDLVQKMERITEFWTDRNRSYLLLFGIDNKGSFLYPGEVPAYRYYFSSKLGEVLRGGGSSGTCALCGNRGSIVNLDKVFKFATFDKVSFLPGATDARGVKEKVFPVCESCFSTLSRGREVLDMSFLDNRTIRGMNIYVVPELLQGCKELNMVTEHTQDFIRSGIGVEEQIFQKLSRQDNILVFHFLFWEKKQAQERLHLMVEDVPPSRLKKLEGLWVESHKAHLWSGSENPDFEENNITLDQAIKNVYGVFVGLAGNSEQDKAVMRESTLGILGKLLNGEKIETPGVKKLMVSRFPGLFSDPEWITASGRYNRQLTGREKLKRMAAVLDFLNRSNRRCR